MCPCWPVIMLLSDNRLIYSQVFMFSFFNASESDTLLEGFETVFLFLTDEIHIDIQFTVGR